MLPARSTGTVSVDSTIARAHQHSATAARVVGEAVGATQAQPRMTRIGTAAETNLVITRWDCLVAG